MIRISACTLAVVGMLSGSTAIWAADSGAAEYRTSLTEVYGAYQRVLSRRDACGTAFPQGRGAIEKAFTSWHGRHKRLISELDQRIATMIHGASKDEKDFARNFGKYEGAILRQREEVKQTLLQQDRSDLKVICDELVELLRSDFELEKEFAEELAVVRKRPLVIR
jgi:hypothetical protein